MGSKCVVHIRSWYEWSNEMMIDRDSVHQIVTGVTLLYDALPALESVGTMGIDAGDCTVIALKNRAKAHVTA